MIKPREADLYAPVKKFLEAQGYRVKGEVGAVDVMALRDKEPPLLVELKLGFTLSLFHQGIDRLSVTDLVYVAVPEKEGRAAQKVLKENVRLARRVGLGVLTVRLRDGHVTPQADPGGYVPRKQPKTAKRLLKAFDRLKGDPNEGGATRHGIVTGYRQDALMCARFLAVHGPSTGAKVKDWAEVPAATKIMAADHYGWFARVRRGVYDLTPEGRKGIADWGDV